MPLQGTVVRVGGDPGVPLHFTPGYLLAAPLGLGIWRGVCSVSLWLAGFTRTGFGQ